MQEYLSRTRLSSFVDMAGLRLALLALSILWFVWLWDLTLPALLAGAAFSALCMLCVRMGRSRTVAVRERKLRARIGGELQLEKLLLYPPDKAHFQAAMWLSAAYPLTLLRTGAQGVLCEYKGERLLLRCRALHPSEKLSAQEVVEAQRAALSLKAARAVLLSPAEPTRAAGEQAELAPRVRLIGRESLIRLAGAAAPATDEQLVALGKRRRTRAPVRAWVAHVLDRRRAPRYALYGLGLLLFYTLTRLPYYPLPAAACIALAVASRCRRPPADTL